MNSPVHPDPGDIASPRRGGRGARSGPWQDFEEVREQMSRLLEQAGRRAKRAAARAAPDLADGRPRQSPG
ncbi:hypothetical protein ABZX75_05340 [Streptomyces sp. NPDC003038]|uniref:hypothetical protein n=1 Tax=unclassified Streptomyces TaxID=2593676 RepID=UPI0033BB7C2A